MNSSSELEKSNLKPSKEQESTEPGMLRVEHKAMANLDKEQITLEYLQNNPGFFNQHKTLLSGLKIPHESGEAVSIIERQVSILRQQNKQHKAQLAELIDIAKENDVANQQIHKLTLALLNCRAIDACEVVLDDLLSADFSVDAVALKLFIEPQAEQPEHLFLPRDTRLGKELEKLLNTRKPVCGYFKQLPLDPLFDDKASDIASMAVLPLFIQKNHCFGALVLGSRNMRHFNPEMGVVFLERLGEIVSHILNAHM